MTMKTKTERMIEDCSAFYFFKLFFVIGTDGPHPSVPEKKIQTVVPFEVLMVLVVIDRSIDPSAQPVPAEISWIKLPAEMTVYIIDDHKEEKERQVVKSYRDGI